MRNPVSTAIGVLLILGSAALAADPGVSTQPEPRKQSYSWMSQARWFEMHAEDVALAEAGSAELVFIGDSITEAWQTTGLEYWNRHFADRTAVNFGIGGDMTQNLLWRLEYGAVGALEPEAVVLLIGVNNTWFSSDSPGQIAEGITAAVNRIEQAFPDADILLQAVFPNGEQANGDSRRVTDEINHSIAPLGQRPRVTFIDLTSVFLEQDGSLSADIMPDFVHLSEEGYRRWANAILPWVDARVPMTEANE